MRENFLVPAMVVRLGQYVSFDNDNGIAKNVKYSGEPLVGNYILMQEVGGEKFICKIRSNVENINSDFIKDFFERKAENNIDKAFELKIKDALENNEDFENELEEILEKSDMSRKEEKEFERKYVEDRIKQIAKAERLIGPGSMVRLPISSSKEGGVEINGEVYPIYESLCLIMKEDNELSDSGIYYISQNRHGIPLKLRSSLKDTDVYYWETNGNLIRKEEFLTLLRHGVRTIEKTGNFFLYFRAYDTGYEKIIAELINKYRDEEDEKKKAELYVDVLKEMMALCESNVDFHKKVIVSLPTKLQKDFVLELDKSLLSKQPMAITNIMYRNDTNKKEKASMVESELNSFLKDKEKLVSLYGVYSIISIYDGFESDTYGFLKNNLKPSSITMDLEDYINFIEKVKVSNRTGVEEVKYKEYGNEYLDNNLNENGSLFI